MPANDPVIVDAIRTPVGKRNGTLKDVHPTDLAAHVIREIARRNRLAASDVDDVVLGCVTQIREQGMNVARVASLLAFREDVVPGVSVNRMCGSGQQAVNFAAQAVASGFSDVVIAGGVESMTKVEISADAGPLSEDLVARFEIVHQGESAERIAEKWNLSRSDLDRFSLRSQENAVRAMDEGRFQREIFPYPLPDGRSFDTDEHPRRGCSLEKLASLKPAFRPDGRITAGNSSGLNDAACVLLVTTAKKAAERGWTPRARIVGMAQAGVDPTIMLTGPIPATEKVLGRTGMRLDDVDLFECNEAFAPVPLAWMQELNVPAAKVNVNGGAIALGHPLGASGARLLTTLLHELERTKKDVGLSTMCIGFGQGIATVIERI
ncbi:MAG: thiolase family protein [Methanobacteriota archaeon]